jgi:hypothetical protein
MKKFAFRAYRLISVAFFTWNAVALAVVINSDYGRIPQDMSEAQIDLEMTNLGPADWFEMISPVPGFILEYVPESAMNQIYNTKRATEMELWYEYLFTTIYLTLVLSSFIGTLVTMRCLYLKATV